MSTVLACQALLPRWRGRACSAMLQLWLSALAGRYLLLPVCVSLAGIASRQVEEGCFLYTLKVEQKEKKHRNLAAPYQQGQREQGTNWESRSEFLLMVHWTVWI